MLVILTGVLGHFSQSYYVDKYKLYMLTSHEYIKNAMQEMVILFCENLQNRRTLEFVIYNRILTNFQLSCNDHTTLSQYIKVTCPLTGPLKLSGGGDISEFGQEISKLLGQNVSNLFSGRHMLSVQLAKFKLVSNEMTVHFNMLFWKLSLYFMKYEPFSHILL